MTTKKKEFKLSDQVMGQIRELVQLSMITRTNVVDHLRAIRVEESEKTEGTLVLSEAYTKGWNEMSEKFHAQAQEKAVQMATTQAMDEDETVVESEDEIVISKDPTTGKLKGERQKIQN